MFSILFQTANESKSLSTGQNKYYYFCVSHSCHNAQMDNTEYIFYTEVKEITCEEAYMKTLSEKWGTYIDNNCMNDNGCTSDLNSYNTYENAKKEFQKTKKLYSDLTKYKCSQVDFNK